MTIRSISDNIKSQYRIALSNGVFTNCKHSSLVGGVEVDVSRLCESIG